MTYEEFLKLIQPGMLDAAGRFLGPGSGVNYQAEGMTPQQFYDFMSEKVSDPGARDGSDSGTRSRGEPNPNWTPGAISTANGVFGNWGVPLAMISAPFAAGALGYGGSTAAGATAGATGGVAGSFQPLALNQIGGTGLSAAELASLAPGATGGVAAGSSSSLLGNVGSFIKDNPTLLKVGGALLGAAAGQDGKTSTSSTKDPWGPAQPYLQDNLKTNAASQEWYRANPFSSEQKAAYQGLLNTIANNQAAGTGLLGNAANFMRSNRGAMPSMTALPTGTQAPTIDWNQYANIGRK